MHTAKVALIQNAPRVEVKIPNDKRPKPNPHISVRYKNNPSIRRIKHVRVKALPYSARTTFILI